MSSAAPKTASPHRAPTPDPDGPPSLAAQLDRLRTRLHDALERALHPLTDALGRRHVRANHVSMAGALICLLAPVLLIFGQPFLAGVVWLTGSAFDLLDGALARRQGKATPYGAFLDSTLDRLSEGALFAGIAYYFAAAGAEAAAAVTVIALIGSLLISYTRARAEALGIACKVGIVTRPERVILLGLGLCFGLIAPVIYLLAVLTLISAAQRVHHTLKALANADG